MVLVYAESNDGSFPKSALEAVFYGAKVAEIIGSSCEALVLGEVDGAGSLGQYGAAKVHQLTSSNLASFDSQVYATAIAEAAKQAGASVVILPNSSNGKSLTGRVAVKLEAAAVSGVNSLPTNEGSFKVKKNVYSGKAIAEYELDASVKVLSLMGNTLKPVAAGSDVEVVALSIDLPEAKVKVKEVKKESGEMAPLPVAELVVSAGRGMKGPENWGIIEKLAEVLGATTACSRPVADTGWRPHHEHVGQTGVAIRPNLYIAIGISGAIQHLAGVSSSKCIVVINKDPEAPFFKAADYGICADLFDVVPRLTAALENAQ